MCRFINGLALDASYGPGAMLHSMPIQNLIGGAGPDQLPSNALHESGLVPCKLTHAAYAAVENCSKLFGRRLALLSRRPVVCVGLSMSLQRVLATPMFLIAGTLSGACLFQSSDSGNPSPGIEYAEDKVTWPFLISWFWPSDKWSSLDSQTHS